MNLSAASEDLQSKVIDFLRFPLIVGVIFIHNKEQTVSVPNMVLGNENYLHYYFIISELFSEILGRVAVPLFYFISGFLFYLNVEFSIKLYREKLVNRVKTLLMPYLFWNVITLLFFYICNAIPQIKSQMNMSLSFDILFMIKSFWEFSDGYPVAYQFWFVRDLMVVIVLSPIIYIMLKQFGVFWIVLFAILWFLGWHPSFVGCDIVAVLFFSLGAWFSINKINLLAKMNKIMRLTFIIYPVFVIIDLMTKGCAFNEYIHKAGIIAGIAFSFNCVSYLFEKNKIRTFYFLSSSAFFVFAIHAPILKALRKVTFLTLMPNSEILLIVLYFGNVLLVVFLALFTYYFLKKNAPRFTAFITGRV